MKGGELMTNPQILQAMNEVIELQKMSNECLMKELNTLKEEVADLRN